MIESLNEIGRLWWGWMGPMLVQTSILIGLVGVADVLLRRWAWPQVRYVLWLMVLVKLVLGPGLAARTSVTADLGPWTESVVSQPMPVVVEERVASVGRGFDFEEASEAAAPVMPETTRQEAAASRPVAAVGPAVAWQVYALGVWLAGVWVLAGWLVVKLHRLRRASWAGPTGDVPEWFDELLQATTRRMGLRRAPAVAVTEAVRSPAVFGMFRPVLLLPSEGIERMSRTDMEHVLLHELAHIKRGDLWVHGLTMLLQVVYWFHPLLWLVRRQLGHLRELCCDGTVARHLRERTGGYRETLLETARRLLAERVEPGLGLLGLFEDSGRLAARLRWLEKPMWRYRPMQVAAAGLVAVMMLVCVLPMARAEKDESGAEGSVVAEQTAVEVYTVNRGVESFGAAEDLSTPEAAYATINRVTREDSSAWARLSAAQLAERLRAESKRNPPIPKDWSETKRHAKILEVHIFDGPEAKKACVLAELPQEYSSSPVRAPIDVRWLALEEGKWLNTGNDRVNTLDEGRAKIARRAVGQKKQTAPVSGGTSRRSRATPPSAAKKEMMGLVEDFFLHNFRDITWRKSLDWGDVETRKDGSRSIRYQYLARIWDKKTLEMNQVFTFDGKGQYVSCENVAGYPKKQEKIFMESID